MIDSRPSDAIALAVRYGVQIYVATAVMDEASFLPEEEEGEEDPTASVTGKKEKSKPTSPPPKMTKLEQLNVQLKEAIEKENYEKAAQLRDEIRKLELRD